MEEENQDNKEMESDIDREVFASKPESGGYWVLIIPIICLFSIIMILFFVIGEGLKNFFSINWIG